MSHTTWAERFVQGFKTNEGETDCRLRRLGV